MPFPAQRFAGLIVPALLWLWLFFHLHYEWTLNAQYNYGWAVPLLAGFVFYLRWLKRPAAKPPRATHGASAGAALLLSLLLPLRVIEEANPDWRLLSWTLALVVVSYSLLELWRAGGAGWIRHFAFPVCFPLVSVPWLVQIENVVVQGLTRAVAFAAVEVAGWIGVGAYQLGNVIELHNGFVGVDEACSGVKTLQAAIMVSLLLGELFEMRVARRLTLFAGGCLWVFACNILRATSLVIITAREGTEALHDWHDAIGTAVVIGGMAGLLALGWFLRDGQNAPPAGALSSPAATGHLHGRTSVTRAAVAIAWLVAVFGFSEFWYRTHERNLVSRLSWQIEWPKAAGTLQSLPIADTTRAILRYDRATSAAWEDPPGTIWWGFFARWAPGRAALQLVRSHSPEICLPAAGRIFRRELPPVKIDTPVLPLAFRAFEFEQKGRPLFVFVCIQEDKVTPAGVANPTVGFDLRSRLLAARRGERNLGQRLLELAIAGVDDVQKAQEALERTVRPAVQPTG